MKDIKKEIIEEFKKFTQIVEYTKWSDEDNVQRLPQAELVWIDSIKNNPKISPHPYAKRSGEGGGTKNN